MRVFSVIEQGESISSAVHTGLCSIGTCYTCSLYELAVLNPLKLIPNDLVQDSELQRSSKNMRIDQLFIPILNSQLRRMPVHKLHGLQRKGSPPNGLNNDVIAHRA
jgi:hypothetical protein